MNISKQEAGEALDAMYSADQRVRRATGYRRASPFLMLWGVLWMVANAVSELAPRFAGRVWFGVLIAGTTVTASIVILQAMRDSASNVYTASERKAIGQRASMLGMTVMAYFPAMLMVLGPLSSRQTNAFISLFCAFAYMASGAWLGMRMFVTGVVTAVAVLLGFFFVRDHYFLWMAVFGGGSLLLAGFWLRKL